MNHDGFCIDKSVDREKVDRIKSGLLSDQATNLLAETFKVLSDPTRVKIVFALLHGELCVCEIVEITGVSQSAISHQLRKLRDLRIVKYRKSSKMVFYSLDDDHIVGLISECANHVAEEIKEPVVIPKPIMIGSDTIETHKQ